METNETSPDPGSNKQKTMDASTQECASPAGLKEKLKSFLNTPFRVSIELGRSRLTIRQLLDVGYHSVFELEKAAGDHLDIYVNDVRLGKGDPIVVEDRVRIKVTEISDNDN